MRNIVSHHRVLLGAAIGALSLLACSDKEDHGDGSRGDRGDGGGPVRPGDPASGGTSPDFGNADSAVPTFGDASSVQPDSGGGCGIGCTEDTVGSGGGDPFDLGQEGTDNVGVDDDGALVIERDQGNAVELIWIANTREGTVSKIDTNGLTELGRYNVPAVDWTIEPGENGPSRTSVDSDGDVYAGARFGSGVTKISAAGDACPDTNGDGDVTTSSGPTDLLPAGEDDCVLWTTDIMGDARGVAVQEIPSRVEVTVQPDAEPVITEIGGERSVWVGGQETNVDFGHVPRLHKLDAETGAILLTLDPPPASTYGLALDGRGNLWMSGRDQSSIARIDTTRCVDDTCNMETVCVTTCTPTSCPDACDDAVLERIDLATPPYGITVDCKQRVWVGGAWGGDGVMRYDPLAPADQRLSAITDAQFNALSDMDFNGSDLGVHGIAADASGFVWGAGDATGVWRIDAETLDFVQVAGTGGDDFSAKGMAVDRRGRVWAIPLRQEYAMMITPGATIDDAVVAKPITSLDGPYTYSDMTGEQRRLAANDPGVYRQVFAGCDAGILTTWGDLEWEVEVPMGTYVVFRARSAGRQDNLDQAEWVELAALPGTSGPIALADLFEAYQQDLGRFVEVEVQLITTEIGSESKDGCSAIPAITPRVKAFGLTHVCPTAVR